MSAGHYTATFDITCEAPAGSSCGYVDIVGGEGAKTFAQAPIPAQARKGIVVAFEMPGSVRDAEFRVFASGAGRAVLRGITVAPAVASTR
jgi:hypothetical protein